MYFSLFNLYSQNAGRRELSMASGLVLGCLNGCSRLVGFSLICVGFVSPSNKSRCFLIFDFFDFYLIRERVISETMVLAFNFFCIYTNFAFKPFMIKDFYHTINNANNTINGIMVFFYLNSGIFWCKQRYHELFFCFGKTAVWSPLPDTIKTVC